MMFSPINWIYAFIRDTIQQTRKVTAEHCDDVRTQRYVI